MPFNKPITLRTNGTIPHSSLLGGLTNMIMSTLVFADNIVHKNSSLVDEAKVDVGLYGDQKRYISVNPGVAHVWTGDSEAANLLALNRGEDPREQTITIDKLYFTWITTDSYLSKQAFSEDGTFSEYTSVLLGYLNDVKRMYEATTYNAFIGTCTKTGSQAQTVTLPAQVTHYYDGTDADSTDKDIEATNRLEAQTIVSKIDEIMSAVEDYSTDFNDYGFLRSFDSDSMQIVFNTDWARKLKYLDTPMIYDSKDLVVNAKKLPARFFGIVNAAATAGDGSTVRSLIEQDITTGGTTTHYRAGDLVKTTDTAPAGTSYTVDDDIICKIYHKGAVPFLSSFTASTEFFNGRSLTKNNYLIWGHNTLEALAQYPFITLTAN